MRVFFLTGAILLLHLHISTAFNSRCALALSPGQSRSFYVTQALYDQRGNGIEDEVHFFLREAGPSDLGFASKILADGFFANRNIFSFQVEKLKTYLSLESCFPQSKNKGIHKYLVACDSKNGRVVGFAEVDCRISKDPKKLTPYMCNLAIDKKWKRMGLATALVQECENVVKEQKNSVNESKLHLKVRSTNMAAIKLYKNMGYSIESSALEVNPQEQNGQESLVLVMSKYLSVKNEEESVINR